MDSSRGIFFASICGLTLVACLSFYIHYSGDLTSRRGQLDGFLSTLKSLQEDLDTKNSLLENTKDQLTKLQKQTDSFLELTNDKQLLSKKITELETARKKMLEDFADQVQKVRLNSEGMELATVTLNNGQVLQGVKLQKFTDASVSLSHSNGLIKVDGKDLPNDLRERFRYGMEPMIASAAGLAPGTTPAGSSTQSANPNLKNATSATHYQIEIEAIDQKIVQLEKSKQEWANLASSYRAQASNSQYAGRPSYTSRAHAAQADQNVQTINTQITKLQEEQVGLRKKMANAMAIP